MSIAIKSLADGQLASSIGDLYEAPASTQAIIKRITLVNTSDDTAKTVNLYFLASGGTARRIIPKDYSLAAKALLIMEDEVTLEAADKIQGDAASATMIDFVISGVENS